MRGDDTIRPTTLVDDLPGLVAPAISALPTDNGEVMASRRRILTAPWALAAMIVFAAGACSSPGPTAVGATSPEGALLPATATELPAFDPPRFQSLLGGLRGIPVVVNVWASWCEPCTVEAPHLAAVSTEYEGRVQFVGVDILDAREPARSFIQTYGWTYPSVFDEPGAIRDGMGLIGQPQTVIFDADGNRVKVFSGPVDAASLRAELDRILQG
jgi:cytochrome c biogenesis protein CcmG/thiol:disulfide interchange protein DsbE